MTKNLKFFSNNKAQLENSLPCFYVSNIYHVLKISFETPSWNSLACKRRNTTKISYSQNHAKRKNSAQFKAEGGGGGEFLQFRQAELLLKECQLWGPQLTCALIWEINSILCILQCLAFCSTNIVQLSYRHINNVFLPTNFYYWLGSM